MGLKKGKVIVIEGCDGSGKATQTQRLYERLINEGYRVKKVEYPNYESESSALVKMYLNGSFGKNPEDVSPYVASTFYAVDRFASYKTDWKEFYLSGGIVIADRYTTANMIHQASKIHDLEEKNKFLDWVWEFEFKIFELPVPDCVVFLDMPPECSRELMTERVSKMTGDIDKDIHEKDYEYLIHSYNTSCEISQKYDWLTINCVDDGKIKSIDKIHNELYENLKKRVLDT
ncbi:dTMP kinase [Clostridium aciditolerans]|uniref:Thymidylate kinase n=1 Tax=Clostridium aciditolerans TaxID=339861 RepID=A0A934HWB7_9CLOT|nr:deoxynucleoside kinase [Clostridium aciditolerans]MBI6873169.1 deoxynucleoside kinase [Clostridium aciditolerans]